MALIHRSLRGSGSGSGFEERTSGWTPPRSAPLLVAATGRADAQAVIELLGVGVPVSPAELARRVRTETVAAVLVVRHPLSAVGGHTDMPALAAEAWLTAAEQLAEYGERDRRLMTVRIEDLEAAPERWAVTLHDYLGRPFGARQRRRAQAWHAPEPDRAVAQRLDAVVLHSLTAATAKRWYDDTAWSPALEPALVPAGAPDPHIVTFAGHVHSGGDVLDRSRRVSAAIGR